jgi:cobalt-zinc-cadmium efflux system outer membrane protein
MARSHAGKIAALAVLAALAASVPADARPLSFGEARQMVLESNQNLKALDELRSASEAAVRQAGAYLNPEIEAETENFGEAEIEVVLTQPLLLGGRRGAAVDVANREAEIAGLEYASMLISVESELIRRYVNVLSANQRIALIDSTVAISNHSIAAVRRLVEAGAAMEVDLMRAELERDELLLEQAGLERDLYEAELKLSELWGGRAFEYSRLDGSVSIVPMLPGIDELGAALEGHPDIAILDARGMLAEAEIREAKSERVPEMALSGGYLRNNELDENAVIAGISFSLPIFNRHKGAIDMKEHERTASEHEAGQIRVERAADLAALYSTFKVQGRELDAISGEVLDRAALIHQSLNDFYLMGKVGILDVLEARAHLLDLHMRIVDLSEERAVLAADIQELTGYPVDVIE